MGHYDECREGYCGKCGQTEGNCEHTAHIKPLPICEFCHPEIQSFFGVNYYIMHKSVYHQIQKEPKFCPNCGRDLNVN